MAEMTAKDAKNIVSRDSYGLEGLPTEREFYFAKGFLQGIESEWERAKVLVEEIVNMRNRCLHQTAKDAQCGAH